MDKRTLLAEQISTDVQQLLIKSFELRVTDITSSFSLAQEALQISETSNHLLNKAKSKVHLAYYHMIIGEHDQARSHAKNVKPVFEENNDYQGMAMVQFIVGSTYYKTEDYHLGLKYLIDSSLMYQKADDIAGQSRVLKAIGSIYEFFREYGQAEETYVKCIELSELCGDKNGMSNAYNPLSGILLKKGEVTEALSIINKSITLKKETKDHRGLGFALYGKAKICAYNNEYLKAESLYLESLNLFKNAIEHVGIMMCHNKLGNLYFTIKKITLAKEHLNRALKRGKNIKHYRILHRACYTLYQIEKSEQNQAAALAHLEQHLIFKDKVINKETKSVIQSIKSISKMEMLEREAHWQKEKTEEVELKNAELDTFVYKVSHDLRGPISSLLGLYEIVKLEVKDKNSLRYFNLYHSQIQRLHNILMDFINLTQIKEKRIEPVQIHFEKMINECIDVHQYYKNFDQITFDIEIENLDFKSDKSTINTVLQNLIENAIKYARNDVAPIINIGIYKKDDQLYIEVEDNGIGINKNYQSRIFEMFFRANDKVQGSGLGLYILKKAVEKLRGSVQFESNINQGSKFQVLIPYILES